MNKKIVTLLILISIFILSGMNQPDIIIERDFVKDEIDNEYEVIESYTFEEGFDQVIMSEPSDHSSGSISLAYRWFGKERVAEFFSFDGISNIKQYELINEEIRKTSEFGQYYLTLKNQKDYVLHRKNGEICFTRSLKDGWNMNLSQTGHNIFMTPDYKTLEMFDNQGNFISVLPEFRNPIVYETAYNTFLDDDKLIACLVGQSFEEPPALFPKGSRLFFFNDDMTVSHYIEVDGSQTQPKRKIQGNYMIYMSYIDNDINLWDKRRIHLLKNNTEILELNGYMASSQFSPDGKLLFLNVALDKTQIGYIVDLEEEEVIKRFEPIFNSSAIANKGYPYLAYYGMRGIQVINYETGELLLTVHNSSEEYESIPGAAIGRLQISGDGKEVTSFNKYLYKKYRINSGE